MTTISQDGLVRFDAERGYTGLLAEGALFPEGDGSWRPDPVARFRYAGTMFGHDRSHDLYLKQKVNFFDWSVAFARDGDTLVLRAERFSDPVRDLETVEATYTRVADRAPDRAMLLVVALEISQGWHFDCFAHQLSDGAGPLLDAMAPVSPDEMEAMLGDIVSIANERHALAAAAKAGPVVNATNRLKELTERQLERMADPRHVALIKRLREEDLGCARLD